MMADNYKQARQVIVFLGASDAESTLAMDLANRSLEIFEGIDRGNLAARGDIRVAEALTGPNGASVHE